MPNYTIRVTNKSGALIASPTNAPTITSQLSSQTMSGNGITSIQTSNGIVGGPITTTGTISVLANSGIIANSFGLFVNTSFIQTLSTNSATYLSTANLSNIETWITGNATSAYTNAVSYVDGKSYVNTSQLSSNLANYQTTAGLSANVATLSSNSATYLGSSITFGNSTGIYTTGTINAASLTVGTSVIANSSKLAIGTAVGLQANGGIGAAGEVLHSNGTTIYWSAVSGGGGGTVTSVGSGNGLTGGPVTTTGSLSVLANNGIIANSTGLFVFANTGLITNATGVHVNTTYVATQSGVETLSSKTLKNQSIQYYNSGTTSALDYTNGSNQRWAPTGSVSLTISNWPASGVLGELLIEGINLGAATITWPTINWIKSDGTTTTTFASNGVTLQSSGTDWVFLWTRDGGTTVYGKIVR
jgi:hypothetical protein